MFFIDYPYFTIFLFFIIISLISCGLYAVAYLLGYRKLSTEKATPYECGFDPYETARVSFNIKFYIVAVLFIIFDLETSFLYAWAIHLGEITSFGFYTMLVFLLLLTLGYAYEWIKGALSWGQEE